MVRKLSLAVAFALGISPLAAQALGLGAITSNSALNQPFSAEIELLSVRKGELLDVEVTLASKEAFDRAGVERYFFLTGFKFTTQMNAQGRPVIRVTSDNIISEPFVDFILDIQAPSGHQLKPYTVLLNPELDYTYVPPVTADVVPQPRIAPKSRIAPQRYANSVVIPQAQVAPQRMIQPSTFPLPSQPHAGVYRATIAPKTTAYQATSYPVASNKAFKPATSMLVAGVKPTPASENVPSSIMGMSAPGAKAAGKMAPVSLNGVAGSYGPTIVDDTLWKIAYSHKHSGVSTEQMIVSIFEANPHAFLNDHVNHMKQGEMLRIPSRDEVLGVSDASATGELRQQMNHWKPVMPPFESADKTAVMAKSGSEPHYPNPIGSSASVRSPAKSDITVKKPVSSKPTPVIVKAKKTGLSLSSPEPEIEVPVVTKDDSVQVASLKNQLKSSQQREAGIKTENADLKHTLNRLEQKISELDRLIELQSTQLRRLEKDLRLQKAKPSVTKKPAVVTAPDGKKSEVKKPVVTQVVRKPEEKPKEKPENKSAVTDKPIDDVNTMAKEVEKPIEKTPESVIQPIDEKVDVKPDVETKKEPKVKKETDKPREIVVEDDSGMMDGVTDSLSEAADIVADNALLVGGTALGIILLPIGWVFFRRRKSAGDDAFANNNESILNDDDVEDGLLETTGALSGQNTEETSFLSGFSSSDGFDTTDTFGSDDLSGIGDNADETSFLSDFVPSDIEALQEETGEVDPLAEADVYIAYGRYRQAEELIRQASEKDPSNVELKHKLFDVLYASKEIESFAQLAEESVIDGFPENDPDAWQKVLSMGRELVPSHELFSSTTAALPDLEGMAAASEEEDDLSLDLDALTSDLGSHDMLDLDMDSGLESLDGLDDINMMGLDGLEAVSSDSGGAMDESFDMNFDLGMDDTDEMGQDSLESDLLDMDFASLEADMGIGAELDDSSDLLDIPDLGDQIGGDLAEDDGLEITGMNKLGAVDEDTGSSADILSFSSDSNDDLLGDLSLDGLDDTGAVDADSGMGMDAEDEEEDEVETKIDLAKAYMDMGDAEGAKELLDEVLGEGSPAQIQEAEELMAKV